MMVEIFMFLEDLPCLLGLHKWTGWHRIYPEDESEITYCQRGCCEKYKQRK
jgi:hypothetical protein